MDVRDRSPGNMNIPATVQPLLNRACKPIDWAAAKVVLWTAIPQDKTRGNTSTVWMKNKPEGLSGVGLQRGFISYPMNDGLDDLLRALFLCV